MLFPPVLAILGAAFSILGLTSALSTTAARDNSPPDPCTIYDSPNLNASMQLGAWMECQSNNFFPYPANGAWDVAFAETFSPDLLASFNDTRYDYAGWLALYRSFNETLGRNFAPFRHGILSTVAVPSDSGEEDDDKGGFVYMMGWEGGWHAQLQRDLWFSDALFAVVRMDAEGKRKVVEMRESSNIPNTAALPEEREWGCGFG